MLAEAAVVCGSSPGLVAALQRERPDALLLADAGPDGEWDARVAAVVAALSVGPRLTGA
jgi:hypothetical protein